jgi:hypothetical protein
VGIEGAKEMIKDMIERAKKTYKISEEPVVDWSKTTNENKLLSQSYPKKASEKPIAEVLITWDEMPGLTKKGDLTNLTYFFQTDYNIATTQLREILEDTDIIWICRVWVQDKSLEIIDLSKNPLFVEVGNDLKHTYDLVKMRDKSPKNQFLDKSLIEFNQVKLTKEVPKILKRLRLKLLCPFPQVLHAFYYEDWKNWRKNSNYYYRGFFPELFYIARHLPYFAGRLGKKHPKYTTSIFLCLSLVHFVIQKKIFM